MAIILHIDSSLENASVSIAENGVMRNMLKNRVQKDHASFLHVAIKEILTNENIHISALDAIAVTAGPGSYTGLRVGFAAAKGLCFALNKPLISVGTLEMMANAALLNNHADADALWCPMIDARRNEVYTALYDADMRELITPHAFIIDDKSFKDAFAAKKILFFGNGADKIKSILPETDPSILQIGDMIPALCVQSFEKFAAKKFADLVLAAPEYAKEFYNG